MKILDELISTIQKDAPIREIFVGVHWTLVSSRGCGMASTVVSNQPHGEGMVADAGSLGLKSALELT